MNERSSSFQTIAWWLSVLGLMPFAISALMLVFIGSSNAIVAPVGDIFKTYAAIILSFLGGIRWGYSMREDARGLEIKTIVISVVPALIGWAILLVPNEHSIMALMFSILAFCAHGAWDSLSANAQRLPAWFSKLRIKITLAVVACHIAVIFALGGGI